MISLRHQAEAVHVTIMEHRASVERYAHLPIGKGGIDEAALGLKRMRIDALEAAHATLVRLADRADALRAASEGEGIAAWPE